MNKVKQDYNDMAAVVDSVEIKGATRYEKVKFIHDFICKRVEYDEKFEIPTAHEPTSVFLTPYKTVCEGMQSKYSLHLSITAASLIISGRVPTIIRSFNFPLFLNLISL